MEEATPGHRTSINLAGLDVEDIHRGDVIARPGTLFPSSRWVLSLRCLSSSPRALRHRAEIHFHHGAKEVPARLYFYDRDKLAPGETALAEVRFSPENGEETRWRAYSATAVSSAPFPLCAPWRAAPCSSLWTAPRAAVI